MKTRPDSVWYKALVFVVQSACSMTVLEELHFFAFNFTQQQIGQATGA